ncbi:MAG TPA: hypothetical protein VJ723_08020 [Candidatus Angelobacter sp.]|nr:hypothetical protein [Candidatus Angelobacter sp.]
MPLPTPTVELVIAAGEKFDRENALSECALAQLLQEFPHNIEISHVLLKVVVLNRLYNTQIYAVETVARHIAGLPIDPLLKAGSPEAFDLIAKVRIGDRPFNFFSFASKYCSWHNPTSYAIYDQRADDCLWAYKKQDRFTNFKRKDLDSYEKFLAVVTAFRDFYGLKLAHLQAVGQIPLASG